MEWHSRPIEEVFSNFKSSKKGLTEKEVQKRYGEFGKNVLTKEKSRGKIFLFFSQFKSLLMIILLVSSGLSSILGHFIDASVIFAIVLFNAVIGFVQEYKAEEIIEKLKKSLNYKVIVFREGSRKEIDSKFLVPGDIVFLEEGNRIQADCRLINSENFQVNESILTGESFPVGKRDCSLKANTSLADRRNMVYAGTTVSSGKAEVLVVATGDKTEFGKLASLVQKTVNEKMPLEKKMDSFSKKLSIFIFILVGFLFVIGLAKGLDPVELFLISVSLAVGSIPEGLPTIIAITLALAIKQMHKVNTLIRKLPAAETLGRATVICTDKTGTITEEKLRVDKIYTSRKMFDLDDDRKSKKDFSGILKVGLLSNNAIEEEGGIIGDPLDSAIIHFAREFDISKKNLTEKNPRIKEIPFTSERKMISIIRENGNIKTIYSKGAAQEILSKCTKELLGEKITPINPSRRVELEEVYREMESSGLRVLGFALKNITKVNLDNAETQLIFVGFVGMIDPPRKEVKEAILEAIEAGIKIKIITGDSLLTTETIAKKIGLEGSGIEGKDLEKVPDQKFDSVVRENIIFARVTPEQKLRIVESLKRQAETVAVTGDGVNDILALKRADIGISMGIRGSDVARDSSDIVLLDDNFASIIKAVRQGRRAFDNIKKSIMFLLSVNAANIFIIIYSILIGIPVPFLPLAILWMNIVTDSIPALALALEKEEDDIMKRGPRGKELLVDMGPTILLSGIFNFITTVILYHWALANYSLEVARTMSITVSVTYAMFFIFSCKSKKSLFSQGILDNKSLIYCVLLSTGIHFVAIYTSFGKLFEFVPLSLNQVLICVVVGLGGLIFFEVGKLIRRD